MAATRFRRILRWVLLGILVLFVGLQLVPAERTNPPVASPIQVPQDVQTVLRRACYDCHSHETHWPWYSYVAPISWRVVSHVDHGRRDLNFSEWPVFDFELQGLAFRDIEEQLDEGTMPLRDYLWLHPEARLSEEDRKLLLQWARSHF